MTLCFPYAAAAAPYLAAAYGFASALALSAEPQPQPAFPDLPYGKHERQVLDFYQAPSPKPTPVAFFIHGGGWGALDKSNVHKMLDVPGLLANGISVASINYRYVHQAKAAGIEPPVKWPLEDAARALQFLRSKAAGWNVDKQRIGASGGSAGACSSLWLALHDDMAQPDSPDPVARESTRLWCAAVVGAQTCLDPGVMREWMPNISYGGQAFGFRSDGKDKAAEFQRFFEARERILPWIRKYSPMEHASADDPPLWLSYSQKTPASKGEEQEDPTHSAVFGLMLEEKLKPLGVDIVLTYPGKPAGSFPNATGYFLKRLKAPARGAASNKPVKVVRKTANGSELLRDGEPFFVKGAVYWARPDNPSYPLTGVVEHGGNSIRVGGEHLDALVEAASKLGLAVTIGLPIKSQRMGFDYDDGAAVRRQFEEMKAIVLRHKDNPATLIWGVGNELSHGNEVSKTYSNLRVWDAVNGVAKLIHEVDPNHPAMTVIGTASLRRGDLKDIIERCPDIDLLGVNSYKDIAQVPEWLQRDGWTKPYLLTEWGGNGSWQVEKTQWGAAIEPTSEENAALVQQRYQDPILKERGRCLGSYVFFWEQAPWITPTWYSLFLASGDRLEAVHVLQHAWTGQWPANRAPAVSPVHINRRGAAESIYLKPETPCGAEVQATDPDGDPLTFQWQILPDDSKAGHAYPKAKPVELPEARSAGIEFTTPPAEGPYRLLVVVRDGKGNAGSANVPFFVRQ